MASSVASSAAASSTASVGVRMLYKAMLRIARVYDGNAILKACIASPGLLTPPPVSLPPPLWDQPDGEDGPDSTAPPDILRGPLEELRQRFLGGRPFYRPASTVWGEGRATPKMVDTVRDVFRDTDFTEQHGRLLAKDVGLVILEQLTTAAKLMEQMVDYDEHRLPSVGDLEGSLQQTSVVGPGVLLMDHPAVTFPGRGVVLVYDLAQNVPDVHGNDKWIMKGWAINRPLPVTAGEVFPELQAHLGLLGRAALFMGGWQEGARRELSIVHCHGDITGSVPIGESGLFAGGAAAEANRKIRDGSAKMEDFKVFMGSEEWEVDMDTQRMPMHERYVFASGDLTKPLTLLPAMYGVEEGAAAADASAKDGEVVGEDDEAVAEPTEPEGYDHERFFHQNVVWSQAMRQLGGEFVEFAVLHPAIAEDIVESVFGTPTGPLDDVVEEGEAVPGADDEEDDGGEEGGDGGAREAADVEVEVEGRTLRKTGE